jgi:predicted MPP superfamily phosphohydrolase
MESLRLLGVGNIGEPPFSTYGDLEAAIASLPTDEPTRMDEQFTILLSHNPTHWRAEVLEYTDIDLTLSGHTHGMQICVGGFSPAVWRYKEWGGLYQEGDRYLYVNTGLGTVGFPVRIGLKPEVTLITLRHTEPLTDEDLEVY